MTIYKYINYLLFYKKSRLNKIKYELIIIQETIL